MTPVDQNPTLQLQIFMATIHISDCGLKGYSYFALGDEGRRVELIVLPLECGRVACKQQLIRPATNVTINISHAKNKMFLEI